MLLHLSISNYALIEKLDLDFSTGFTVITGETGAGKSLLLGAISMILGNRIDNSLFVNSEKKCTVEGVFKLDKEKFEEFFIENDIDFEEETSIRREITTTGKSRAFVNDTPVNLNIIKEIVEILINIHSQHQNLLVKSGNYQLAVVDSYSNSINEAESVHRKFKQLTILKNKLNAIKNAEHKAKNEIDFLQFQIQEIDQLKLLPNEQESLEEQLKIIKNSVEIKSTLLLGTQLLNENENNIISNSKRIYQSITKLSDLSPEFEQTSERLNSVIIELIDISREISRLNDNLNFDDENTENIENRLSSIYTLERKHQLSNSNDLLNLLDNLKLKLKNLGDFEGTVDELEKNIKDLEDDLYKIADDLSKKRKKSIVPLTSEINKKIKELGMPDASFIVEHTTDNELGVNGLDKINFLFSANKGFVPTEIHKTASGGEISRLMLTLKLILSKSNNLSTIIFDEIDTGVSGDIADKMGEIMKQMAENIQIITVTHLPQVAAKGKQNLKITKQISNDKTITEVVELSKEEKINEIAKMLSGKELTKASIENAKNLISN